GGGTYRHRLNVDEEHRGARATRINRAMQAVGERGSAPDHGHAQPAGGIVVSVSHGYGAVLVSCAVEPCPRVSSAVASRAVSSLIRPKANSEAIGTISYARN